MYFGDEGVLFKAGLPPLFGVAAVISFWLSNGTNKSLCFSEPSVSLSFNITETEVCYIPFFPPL